MAMGAVQRASTIAKTAARAAGALSRRTAGCDDGVGMRLLPRSRPQHGWDGSRPATDPSVRATDAAPMPRRPPDVMARFPTSDRIQSASATSAAPPAPPTPPWAPWRLPQRGERTGARVMHRRTGRVCAPDRTHAFAHVADAHAHTVRCRRAPAARRRPRPSLRQPPCAPRGEQSCPAAATPRSLGAPERAPVCRRRDDARPSCVRRLVRVGDVAAAVSGADWPRLRRATTLRRPVVGLLYPAYMSFKAIKMKNIYEYNRWMMYWIVFGFFSCATVVTDTLLSWLPLYSSAKIAFLLWLVAPQTRVRGRRPAPRAREPRTTAHRCERPMREPGRHHRVPAACTSAAEAARARYRRRRAAHHGHGPKVLARHRAPSCRRGAAHGRRCHGAGSYAAMAPRAGGRTRSMQWRAADMHVWAAAANRASE